MTTPTRAVPAVSSRTPMSVRTKLSMRLKLGSPILPDWSKTNTRSIFFVQSVENIKVQNVQNVIFRETLRNYSPVHVV